MANEKKRYVHEKKSKKTGFGKNFETAHLQENDGSFVNNYFILRSRRTV
jgi:hypothetical protein